MASGELNAELGIPVVGGVTARAFSRELVEVGDDEYQYFLSEVMEALLADGFYEIDLTATISIAVEPDRPYLIVSLVEASSAEGTDIDGFSTFTLENIVLPPGMSLNSQAAIAFGAEIPLAPVPLPGTAVLLVPALAALAARRKKAMS